MRRLYFMFLFLGTITMNSLAQEEKPIKYETKNFSLPDKMPLYPGGDGALRAFLSLNLHYPEKAQAFGVEGRSLMKFCVSSDGSIKDISAVDCKVTNYNSTKFNKLPLSKQESLKKECAKAFAKEAARVIRLMPKWEPAELNGEKMNVYYSLPFTFKLR